MYFHKIPLSLLLIFLTLATIFHDSKAQNSQADFLTAHNTPRALVFANGAMTWSNTLGNYSLNYANARAGACNMVPSGGPYGENLATGSGPTFTGVAAVNIWVNQKPNYNYAANTCSGGQICTSYTQVVWANSVQLGCARVLCTNNVFYLVVCSYSVKGNVAGEWPY
ncbi:pathogenesis-related protein 1-like [Heracleum sosnowskyi]|uniref:Pathogenesis-related protein 1-like n=1 Tax=Heracleum sosnowskyi TaxID=360622 RepID=A0AAD8MCW7_9APIA|nr:pathogenesis-related protein 1-like [Heracleum sosnowskyi]